METPQLDQTSRSVKSIVREQPSSGEMLLNRPLTREMAAARCPSCNSIIYSRRHTLCGICGEQLPEQLLFSPSESARLAGLLSAERKRYRQWISRDFRRTMSPLELV